MATTTTHNCKNVSTQRGAEKEGRDQRREAKEGEEVERREGREREKGREGIPSRDASGR